MNTYIIDKLFEKYMEYSTSLTFFDKYEMERKETEKSASEFREYLKRLNKSGYFLLKSKGNLDEADKILSEEEKNYKELNPYIIELKKISSDTYYDLRISEHLSIVNTFNTVKSITSSEDILFKKIYKNELDYMYINYSRPDLSNESLFNKISIIFLIFSTILTIIKEVQKSSLRDQYIDEYYLNNFLVSHGFLFYNNINYDKKKEFSKYIMNFHNNKGSFKNILDVLKILLPKASDIFEYYLFYDENFFEYYFLKVKPSENFIEVFNNKRNERQVVYELVVSEDPSWIATKDDLLRKDIKFIKTKYFSIDTESDISSANRELSFLVNKTKRYRDLFNRIYKFEIDTFPKSIEMNDFIMFLNLMSMRVNGYALNDIKYIKANEKIDKFLIPPRNYEGQEKDDSRKNDTDIIIDSIKEIQITDNMFKDIEYLKNGNRIKTSTKTIYDNYRQIKKSLNTVYISAYRPAVADNPTISTFDYLTNKYTFLLSYLEETDKSILISNFMNFIDTLEKILILYGQTSLKYKDIYSNLYLPAIVEIIRFFKSMNAHLFELSNSLVIEEESRLDKIADDYTTVGTIKISNRDKYNGNNSGNPDYNPDDDFPNKEDIKDEEIDLIINLTKPEIELNESVFGKEKINNVIHTSSYSDSIVETFPTPTRNNPNMIYTSFSRFMPYVNSYTEIFDTQERLEKILKNNDMLYMNGKVIDFFGNEGSYKELREKYGLSYFDFKDKVSKIVLQYDDIFGLVTNRLGVKKEDYIYNRNKRIPFIKKPYLFKRVTNKVTKGDPLMRKLFDRSTYTDVVHIFKFDKTKDQFEHAPEYTDKYRSTIRKQSPKYEDLNLEKYAGKRRFKEFIKEVKEQKELIDNENNFIGLPNLPV